MSTTYEPGYLPEDLPSLVLALRQELRNLKAALEAGKTYEVFDVLFEEPERLEEGMTVRADGTLWNPGGGAGMYTYYGGAWNRLG